MNRNNDNVYDNFSYMAYKNSFDLKNKNYSEKNKLTEQNKSHVTNKNILIDNLKKENEMMKSRLSLVIEKDRELYKFKVECEKYKKIIAKYNIENIDNLKKENEILQKKINCLIKKIKNNSIEYGKLNDLNLILKDKLIEIMNNNNLI
tara:strand:- start:597 stop:1040 length:444 start_codon:yes stop_codon:yes gene_type:complete